MIRKVVVTYPAGSAGYPLIYELIKKYDIMVSIIKADIDAGRSGKLVLELDSDQEHISNAVKYMEEAGFKVNTLGSKIQFNQEKCVSCGACTSSCLTGALSIGAPDWKVQFDPDKCVVCKLCITACPLRLFKIEFVD